MRHAKETNFKHVLTGHETWFYYEYPHDSAWAPLRATLPTRTSKKIQAKKCLISIIWPTSGIHSLLALPAGVQYDAEFLADLSCRKSKGISAMVSVRRGFEASTSIAMTHQLTMPNDRGKKLPERKPAGSYIRLILLTLHPATSSCLVT
jgi:hypothetical protein